MAHYRVVDTKIWNDAKFRALSWDARMLFLYVLTHPQMMAVGAMRSTLDSLWQELCRTRAPLVPHSCPSGAPPVPHPCPTDAAAEIRASGMVREDESACFLCLPNWFKYNAPHNQHGRKFWLDTFDILPECALASEHKANAQKALGGNNDKKCPTRAPHGAPPVPHMVPQESPTPCPTVAKEQRTKNKEQGYKPPIVPKPTPSPTPKKTPVAWPWFDEFWATWPASERKSNKQGAREKLWDICSKSEPLQSEILAGLVKWTQTKQWTEEPEYIPMPLTWINQARWEDAPDRAATVSKANYGLTRRPGEFDGRF